MKPSRALALLLVLILALGAAACGQEEGPVESGEEAGEGIGQVQSEAETEGLYVDIGGLKYQVQVSRQLNPRLVGDRDYFASVPESEMDLGPDETWFGVFVRAENTGEEPARSARRFEVKDTQENIYVPVEVGEPNPFAYRPTTVQPRDLLPDRDSPAGERQPNGALLLFKLKRFSLDNRPLGLFIYSPEGDGIASVNLDV
jgi:hypothetical protein